VGDRLRLAPSSPLLRPWEALGRPGDSGRLAFPAGPLDPVRGSLVRADQESPRSRIPDLLCRTGASTRFRHAARFRQLGHGAQDSACRPMSSKSVASLPPQRGHREHYGGLSAPRELPK